MLSWGTAPHNGALEGIKTHPTFKIYSFGVMVVVAIDPKGMTWGSTIITAHSRMLALSFDIAATASSCVANSTSASPVTLPSGPTSIWTRTGFNGEKNYGRYGETSNSKYDATATGVRAKPWCAMTCIVNVRLCGPVWKAPHVNAVSRCTLEGGATVAIASIWYTWIDIRS